MGRHLEVTDRRMAAAVTLVIADPLIAGTPSLMREVMGDRMLHRGACAQRGMVYAGRCSAVDFHAIHSSAESCSAGHVRGCCANPRNWIG